MSGPLAFLTSIIDVSLVTSGSGTWSSGDYMGMSGSAMEFSGAARSGGNSGCIMGAELVDSSGSVGTAFDLWLFNTQPTPPADNAAWSIADADANKALGVISFSTYKTSALNCQSAAWNQNIPFVCAAGSTSLWGCVVPQATTGTHTSGDILIRLGVSQD